MSLSDRVLAAIQNDFSLVVGQITVTLTTPGSGPVSVAGVTHRAVRRTEFEMLGLLGVGKTARTFSLPVPSLNGAKPRRGDTITDENSTSWTIQDLTLTSLGTRWIAVCLQKV